MQTVNGENDAIGVFVGDFFGMFGWNKERIDRHECACRHPKHGESTFDVFRNAVDE